MKIYTKTGDEGKTGLIGGTRVLKCDLRIEAYGTIDELNSHIGLLAAHSIGSENKLFLEKIQHVLFALGSYLATDVNATTLNQASILSNEMISDVESEIDRLNVVLPDLTQFILPGGSVEGALCHVCRTVTRRAERRIVELNNMYNLDNNVVIYINRLSDYFFVLSRFVTVTTGCEEIFWKKQ